jgi:hypothetical protein
MLDGGHPASTSSRVNSGSLDSTSWYLSKNPNGYCGLGETGLSCPVGVAKAE